MGIVRYWHYERSLITTAIYPNSCCSFTDFICAGACVADDGSTVVCMLLLCVLQLCFMPLLLSCL